jgi:hypothetical protein
MASLRKRVLSTSAVAVALVAALLFGDYWLRCHGKPLARDEALKRANIRMQYLSKDWVLGSPLPVLVAEQYDPKDGSWMFTFRNNTCQVDIVTDRCNGTDVGGMSKGCTTHQPDGR